MGVLINVFVGLAVVTAVLLVGAFGAWYYVLREYAHRMNGRALALMKFVVPPFMLLIASPVVDVALWALLDFDFPTIGFTGTVVGLVGASGALGYVIVDLRESTAVRSRGAT